MASFLDAVAPPAGSSGASDLFGQIAQGAQTYYGTLAQINEAKYGSQLVKAQAQAAVAQARAAGVAGAEYARAGVPSSSLLLIGGLGLLAILALKK